MPKLKAAGAKWNDDGLARMVNSGQTIVIAIADNDKFSGKYYESSEKGLIFAAEFRILNQKEPKWLTHLTIP